MIEATIKGLDELKRALERAERAKTSAKETAVKVEAFRLRGELKKHIQKGVGEPLTFLARRKRGSKSFRPNKPLSKLAAPIRYDVKSKKPFSVAIGWTEKTGKSWQGIAARQQAGFTSSVTDRRRSYFKWRGDEVSERSQNRKYFFLRKSTTTLETPARPIIDPFFKANQTASWGNIRANFRRKMAGERI